MLSKTIISCHPASAVNTSYSCLKPKTKQKKKGTLLTTLTPVTVPGGPASVVTDAISLNGPGPAKLLA